MQKTIEIYQKNLYLKYAALAKDPNHIQGVKNPVKLEHWHKYIPAGETSGYLSDQDLMALAENNDAYIV